MYQLPPSPVIHHALTHMLCNRNISINHIKANFIAVHYASWSSLPKSEGLLIFALDACLKAPAIFQVVSKKLCVRGRVKTEGRLGLSQV